MKEQQSTCAHTVLRTEFRNKPFGKVLRKGTLLHVSGVSGIFFLPPYLYTDGYTDK